MSGERPTQGHSQHAAGGTVLWEEQCSASRGRQSDQNSHGLTVEAGRLLYRS